jgi:hypothetical protein
MRCHCARLVKRAAREAMAAPIWTMAASRPTEPPDPLWIPAASDLMKA